MGSYQRSYENLAECIGPNTIDVARALHISPSIVYKWQQHPATEEEYTQSGTRNPEDRIETIISTIEPIDPKRAYLPIYRLNARFGFLPPVKKPDVNVDEKCINQAVFDWIGSFGKVTTAVSDALADNVVTKAELIKIVRAMDAKMVAGLELVHLLEAVVER